MWRALALVATVTTAGLTPSFLTAAPSLDVPAAARPATTASVAASGQLASLPTGMAGSFAGQATQARSTSGTLESGTGDGGAQLVVLRAPVDAEVFDPFRKPENPYGPGNRGIEYATTPSQPVRAAASGVVSFAGPVASELYVTVDHGDGVLTSYSYLGRLTQSKGDLVTSGDVVGFTGERNLHFGLRVNGEYEDPALFMAVREVRVRLVSLREDAQHR